jgi:hypothetical protein
MNSYISSFKALLTALVIIAAVESGYATMDTSSPVESSNYLNWNYNSTEPFHKLVILEKLRNAVRNKPDVIQIGDSAGFHAIVPRIVDQYLGGLRYDNLSCCANTGFDGYYALAEYMLRRTPSIKAVVLYMSLNNPPIDPARVDTEVVGGQDRIRNAFGTLAPFMSPPSLSARPKVVATVHGLGHPARQPAAQLSDRGWLGLFDDLRLERGWWPEHDPHHVPRKHAQMLNQLCGPSGVRTVNRIRGDYTRDILGSLRAYPEIELRRLADLTARHNAKLIVLIQPFPCRGLEGSFLPAFRADIAAVAATYPNVILPNESLFEPWPGEWFTSADHLRLGHEDAASRRAGRAVAKALGMSIAEPPAVAPTKPPVPVWSSSDFNPAAWRSEGLRLKNNAEGTVATETTDTSRHFLESTLPDLQPKTYVASVLFSTTGSRQIALEYGSLQMPGDYGYVHCSPSGLESTRPMSVLDSGMEELPNDVFRCWAKFKVTKAGVIIGIGLASRSYDVGPYRGDGTSSIVLYGADLSAVDDPPRP